MYLESRKVILEPYLNSDYQRFYWTQRFNCDYFLTLLELYLNLFGTIFAPNLNFASTLNLNLIRNWTLFEPNLNLAWTIKNFIWTLIEPCLNLLELFINQLIVKLSPENLLILNIKTGSHKKSNQNWWLSYAVFHEYNSLYNQQCANFPREEFSCVLCSRLARIPCNFLYSCTIPREASQVRVFFIFISSS